MVACEDTILVVITMEKLREILAHQPECMEKLQKFKDDRKDWYSNQDYSIDDDFGGELLTSIARQKISGLKMMDIVDDSFVEALSMTVVGEVYQQNSLIISIKDEPECMFFVMSGIVEVVGESGEVYAELSDGSHFGEVGILFSVKRTASVRAKTDVILFKLTKQALTEVAERHPVFERRIQEEASQRYKAYMERNNVAPVELFEVEVSESHLMQVFSVV